MITLIILNTMNSEKTRRINSLRSNMILNVLNIKQKDLNNYFLHFAEGLYSSYDALNAFYRAEFKEWQEAHLKWPRDRKFMVSLIYFGNNEWLFAGIYEIIVDDYSNDNAQNIHTKLLEMNSELIGKLVLSHLKIKRKKQVNLEFGIHHLELSQILKDKQNVPEFNGFSNAIIDFELLKSIVNNENSTWQKALGNARGIYLITDTKTGRLYVGSVYGESSFWEHWKEYALNGHGGNRALQKMLMLHGKSYAVHLQFSFLEVMNDFVTNEKISERELFWKKALKTIEFGYNIT